MRSIFYITMGWILFAGGFVFVPHASADDSKLTIPVVKYRGGNYKPRPEAVRSLMAQLARRTSIEVNRETLEIELTDPDLYRYPFIYMAGNGAFNPFSKKELRILRHYLGFGGFLLIDDNSSKAHSGFDASIRELMSELFPKIPLQKISRSHSIYRSFYLINRAAGRIVLNPFLEGISVKGRTVLVYSTNDLGGAWARDKLGHWSYDIIAGGNSQRQGSIRLAVNIVMYALTLDYKKDMVHLPIILERLRRHHSK
jgi:Domain of unknown function (DUF4159)